jgi:hypothetical protein
VVDGDVWTCSLESVEPHVSSQGRKVGRWKGWQSSLLVMFHLVRLRINTGLHCLTQWNFDLYIFVYNTDLCSKGHARYQGGLVERLQRISALVKL